jgi:hypothetical protein
MPWHRRHGVVLAIGLLWLASGCGDAHKPVKLKGKVTLDGEAVEGALVTFMPEGGGRPASGRTGADGVFSLTTLAPGDGVVPGDYKVVIDYVEPPPAPGNSTDPKAAMDEIRKAARQPRKNSPRYQIPAQYKDPAKTTLRIKVPPKDSVVFDLSSKGP